jgi:N-acetylglucosaminyldiphosphoundecaprenol N-acetyl-beta-D-mannosaminyltransferase
MREEILGINIDVFDMNAVLDKLLGAIRSKDTCVVVCANPHSIVESLKNLSFKAALNNADIVLPDGIGIVLASKMGGKKIGERVCGPDVFIKLTKSLNKTGGGKYFFYGSTNETLSLIRLRMEKEYPNINIVGAISPPFEIFTDEEVEKHITMVNESGADILWVGMTAPKQELWIDKYRSRLNVNVIGAIGAAFDFFAETKKRCPVFIQKAGLEWLFRFILEPKRLWRRNIVSMPKFLLFAIAFQLKRMCRS